MNNINVTIAGATGYIGLELVKLLVKHPKIRIKHLCAQTSAGKKISYFDSFFNKYKNLPKISKFRLKKHEHFEISLPNRDFHAKVSQNSIVFERGELKYRVSERGKNVPGPEFHSAFNAEISRF